MSSPFKVWQSDGCFGEGLDKVEYDNQIKFILIIKNIIKLIKLILILLLIFLKSFFFI